MAFPKLIWTQTLENHETAYKVGLSYCQSTQNQPRHGLVYHDQRLNSHLNKLRIRCTRVQDRYPNTTFHLHAKDPNQKYQLDFQYNEPIHSNKESQKVIIHLQKPRKVQNLLQFREFESGRPSLVRYVWKCLRFCATAFNIFWCRPALKNEEPIRQVY